MVNKQWQKNQINNKLRFSTEQEVNEQRLNKTLLKTNKTTSKEMKSTESDSILLQSKPKKHSIKFLFSEW